MTAHYWLSWQTWWISTVPGPVWFIWTDSSSTFLIIDWQTTTHQNLVHFPHPLPYWSDQCSPGVFPPPLYIDWTAVSVVINRMLISQAILWLISTTSIILIDEMKLLLSFCQLCPPVIGFDIFWCLITHNIFFISSFSVYFVSVTIVFFLYICYVHSSPLSPVQCLQFAGPLRH